MDPGLLTYRDRAALRILYRTDVATTAQLTALVYHRRQTAQERLAALYSAGYLERAILPPTTRGGAPFAFRVSPRGRRRLHFDNLTRSRAGTQLRHSLNGVETVCALLAAQPPEATEPFVTAWLTEMMAHDTLPRIYPDAIVALQGASGSALLCLEIDESTERSPVIRDKLARYETALWSRIWDVVFVVGSPERASRLAAIGRATPIRAGLAGKAWVLVLPDLRAKGLAAPLVALNPGVSRTAVGGLLVNPAPRRCPTPVGSEAWLRLLGTGGVEDYAEALR